MARARIVLDRDFTLGPVPRRLFGSFVEHMCRCVYTGIYEPGHPSADEHGFRLDVLALTKELGVLEHHPSHHAARTDHLDHFVLSGIVERVPHPLIAAPSDPSLHTLPVGLASLRGALGAGLDFPVLLAGSVLITIPVALVFVLFQRYFAQGVASAGIKGQARTHHIHTATEGPVDTRPPSPI